jgi:very-short-patch-repair endonuclease
MPSEEYFKKAKGVHGDKYDYSKAIYKGNDQQIEIVCKIHGSFWQRANDHLSKKAGCPMCAGVKRYTTTDFVTLATQRHEGKYTYEKVNYVTTETKVIITCPKHGDFLQTPHDHLQGVGCPSCKCNGISKGETELKEFVESLGFVVETRDRTIIKPYELDIVLPEVKIALEFNGLYYHSDKFVRNADHKKKTDMAREAGYRLLHIYEDDWRDRQEVVKKTIKHVLGKVDESVYARNLIVAVKNHKDCKDFYDTNHIQGSGKGDSWCLMDGDEIVAAMQFAMATSERGNTDDTRWELVRFASSKRVVGGASKLLEHFRRANQQVKTLISYSDNDLFDGNMYEQLGFVKDSDVKPDYKVIVNGRRVHKAQFRKDNIAKFYPEVYDENLTEREMCQKLGYYRIYNSGLVKWRLDF